MIGKTLGHYQVSSQLGKGGMGEVYQAKDQVLGRDVAIKVLPEEFARDADRVARFQREAKLLASLNHPNIATIHGLEESGGKHFLVMELVEGETLADRIKGGPIPVEESLKLALQIAEALEAAHEKGVIHRDLKPANIKATPEGKVKVLDFGLAKAFAGEKADLNLSNSPTLSEAATMQGVILGTAAYMSPEQAKGKTVDKRTDIWAFGVVLFEILTGRAAFQGDEVSEILASVIKGETDLDLLHANIHPRVRELLSRCLQKDLRKRYPDIANARYEIEQVLADPGGVLVQPVTTVEQRKKLRTILPWAAAALVFGLIIAGIAGWKLKPSEPRPVMRFVHELPEGQQFSGLRSQSLNVSPDGKSIAYGTTNGIYLRSVDELTAKLITGTEGPAHWPFFSPDGKWIGYVTPEEGKLKKIGISGGAPVVLCDVGGFSGASWNEDNTIVYGQLMDGPIMRVPAKGGTPEALTKTKFRLIFHPQILPDGETVLYTAGTSIAQTMIVVQSLKSGEPRELFSGFGARYLPTGHMVYLVGNDLLAVSFDLKKLEATGGAVPIVEGIYRTATPQYALSNSGTLAFIPSTSGVGLSRSLVWSDRKGKEEPLGAPQNVYRFPNISPDGTKVAMTVFAGDIDSGNIWVWNLVRKTLTRLTFEGTYNVTPLWTSDGTRIAFLSARGASEGNVFWRAADGAGKDEELASSAGMFFPCFWSDGGKALVGEQRKSISGNSDIAVLSMEGDRALKPILQESYAESQPKISPDGRWMVYTSNESGRKEIYVRPFPDANKGRWQVSTGGGNSPLWAPDGRELFYRNGDTVMAVLVKTGPDFSIDGMPQVLFRGPYVQESNLEGTPWDIHPDGKRFLMMKPSGSDSSTAVAPRPRITVVVNWLEELKQRVPVK